VHFPGATLRCPREVEGDQFHMDQTGIDRLARMLARRRSRRRAVVALGLAFFAFATPSGRAARNRNGNSSFSRKCRRFVISAGPARDERFQHIDDDLMVEVIPKGGGQTKVVFEDDNDLPNGDNGSHPKGLPFTARVGDHIRIVARNEAPGGCELDEIWLHCVEGRGGRVMLSERITPEDCSVDADEIGVFYDETFRIRNK
jgi:hypothetical protein